MHDNNRLLIVVPCLNEAATLGALIAQMRADAPGATIVIADGGSTDGSRAIVSDIAEADPGVVLMDNPARLQSAGVNRAVNSHGAGHDWLLRVDAHCAYPPGYTAMLIDAARRTGADSVVVPMVTQGTACFQRAVAAAQNSRLGTGGSPHRHIGAGRFVDHGHHALFRLARYAEVGGYDEAFSHNEDAELDCRLTARGARIWLEPAANIIYYPRATLTALFRQYRGYGRGRARTVRKHGLKLKLRQRLPQLVLPAVILGGIGIAAGPGWPMVLAIPALAWLGLSLAFGAVVGIRSHSLCIAASGVAAVTMHLAWSIGYWETSVRR